MKPYIFRACFIDPFQGLVMAKFARVRATRLPSLCSTRAMTTCAAWPKPLKSLHRMGGKDRW